MACPSLPHGHVSQDVHLGKMMYLHRGVCAQEKLSPWPHCRTPQHILNPPKTQGYAPIHIHPMAKVAPRPQYIFQLPQISGTPEEMTEARDKVWKASEAGEESHMGTFPESLSSKVGTVGSIYKEAHRQPLNADGMAQRWPSQRAVSRTASWSRS